MPFAHTQIKEFMDYLRMHPDELKKLLNLSAITEVPAAINTFDVSLHKDRLFAYLSDLFARKEYVAMDVILNHCRLTINEFISVKESIKLELLKALRATNDIAFIAKYYLLLDLASQDVRDPGENYEIVELRKRNEVRLYNQYHYNRYSVPIGSNPPLPLIVTSPEWFKKANSLQRMDKLVVYAVPHWPKVITLEELANKINKSVANTRHRTFDLLAAGIINTVKFTEDGFALRPNQVDDNRYYNRNQLFQKPDNAETVYGEYVKQRPTNYGKPFAKGLVTNLTVRRGRGRPPKNAIQPSA